MESVASAFGRAVAAHREAVSNVEAARARLGELTADARVPAEAAADCRRWAAVMRQHAAALTPGWLGCRLDGSAADLPTGRDAALGRSMTVRLGDASPVPDGTFSVVVPFVGAGHVAIDRDARDEGVARWLRGLLLRVVAALPDGAVRVASVDGATLGAVFGPFRALVDAEAWRRPAIDLPGLQQVLTEAEERIEGGRAGERDAPVLLVCCAAADTATHPPARRVR